VPASVHFWPAQQGPPATPQVLQVPVAYEVLVQAVFASVQTSVLDEVLGQQGSPFLPQPQRPAWHMP
jgi:hypothetical protein